MKKLLLASTVVFAFGCSKFDKTLDKMDRVPEKLDKFSDGMNNVNEKTQIQAISEAEDKLLNEENMHEGTPIPFKMMSPAKVLASFMTTEQALNWVKLKIATINSSKYTGAADNASAQGKFNLKKMGLLTAVTFVAGFLPEKTMNEMIETQIKQSGFYQSTALSILFLKAKFINDVLLAGIYSEGFTTLGHLVRAIELNSELESLEALPFASEIGLQVIGFSVDKMNVAASGKLDTARSQANWVTIKKLAIAGFNSAKELESSSSAKVLSIDKKAFDALIEKVDAKIQSSSLDELK